MYTGAFAQGRHLIQTLVDEWPGPACDAIDGARMYLAYSCIGCGTMLWPENEVAGTHHPREVLCVACRTPHVLKFVESDLLIGTLRELLFAWPPELRQDCVIAAEAYLQQYSPEIV